MNSAGISLLSSGPNQFWLDTTDVVEINSSAHLPIWIEAAWLASDGTLYAWYHHEPGGLCPGSLLTAPRIGALVSHDGGKSFIDLGIILESGDPMDCAARNGFFGGGHGDFSVIVDREQEYFYFFFTNYTGDRAGQGVTVARMAFADRDNPVGAVWKYYRGGWDEPGIKGRVTAFLPAKTTWDRADADSFWGPSIHWNTHLETYVMLLNRACCQTRWPQEGIYISFNPDPGNPAGWTAPERILQNIGFGPGYYPQVLGTGPGETDSVAGRFARLYVHGISNWGITFIRPEDSVEVEPEEPSESDPAGPNP